MKKRALHKQRGFSLIETIVGQGIIGVFVVTVLAAVSGGMIGIRTARDASVAESLTRSQLEYVKGSAYLAGGGYPLVTTPSGYSLAVSTSTVPGADPSTIQQVTVSVYRGGSLLRATNDFKVNR